MENLIKKKWIIKTNFFYLLLSCFSLMVLLQGCSIKLAPQYDVKIVETLTESSIEILSLFAEVSEGIKKVDYSKREEKYNKLIGKLEALELQIKARPLPSNKTLTKIKSRVNKALENRGIITTIKNEDNTPSAKALENIIKNIKVLKDDDKIKDVDKAQIDVYKGAIILFLDQALTYEKFLNPKI